MRHQILSVLAAALVTGGTACSNLTDINTNPNGPVDVPPPAILSNALQNAIGNSQNDQGVLSVGLDLTYGGVWAQQFSEIQYRDGDRYLLRSGTGGGWDFYNNAGEDFQRMIVKGVAANVPNWDAVGRIMKSYLFSVMTEAMGDLPYSEALRGDTVRTPKYDKQQDIYTALFADLTKANQEIDSSRIGFGTEDLMYRGRMTKWRKLANSLRLRLAIHLSNVDATTAAAQAQAAVAARVVG